MTRKIKNIERTDNIYTNVKDFGASGDGVNVDTQAIQRAVNAGGIVFFPPGIYITGTIYLKSHGGIMLAAGAVIKANPDLSDYNADDFCPQNRVLYQELVSGRHLIVAVEQENITIAGQGCIDGNFSAWMNSPDPELGGTPPYFKRPPERPGQMIYLCECSDVRIHDVEMTNASYWHCFLHGCEKVTISGIRIYGVRGVINNDGIDLDCCRHVTISNCIILTADDSLTLRADYAPLKKSRRCEYITVSNCVLSSYFANAIRIGVGNGEIRRCSFNNISISESRTGICMVSRYWEQDRGVSIFDLNFSDMQIYARRPFCIKLDNKPTLTPPCSRRIGDIRFMNISGTAELSSYLTGSQDGTLDKISFDNVAFRYSGKGLAGDLDEHGHWGCSSTDSAFELCYARNISFTNSEISWETNNPGWRHDIRSRFCESVIQSGCRFKKGIFNYKGGYNACTNTPGTTD